MGQFADTENQKIVRFSHQFRKTGVKGECWSGDLLFHSNSSHLGAKIDVFINLRSGGQLLKNNTILPIFNHDFV